MKIFILLMFLNGGGSDIDFQPLVKHVGSPEAATVMLWKFNELSNEYTGQLYCMDIDAGTVTELQIPEVEFGYRADPDQGQYELKPRDYGSSITIPSTSDLCQMTYMNCNDCELEFNKD